MHQAEIIRDLAIVMMVSGITTLIFRRLKQPVVLGYLLAGCLVGPHTPGVTISGVASVEQLAQLGLLFLMFSLGLDFSLRKLGKVGTTAGLAAVFEISIMVWLGVMIGGFFDWPLAQRLLLGAGLAISSTAIIVKALRDAGEMGSEHGDLISGMLVVEDIFIILVMTFLPGFADGGQQAAGSLAIELLKLPTILIAIVVVGLLAVPKLLQFVGRFRSNEILLIVTLGLLFGSALLMESLHYSIALGAFLIGALAAESRALGRIKDLTEPLRDMFSAVFFVSMGMLIEPGEILPNIVPILVITVVFMVGKTVACSLGLFMVGHDAKASLQAGLNMAQLGEFAFIIATLGAGLGGKSLFAVFVSTAVLNAIARPYLVGHGEAIRTWLARMIPAPLLSALVWYNHWISTVRRIRRGNPAARYAWNLLMQVAVNCALVAAIFLVAAFVARLLPGQPWFQLPGGTSSMRPALWLGALICSMPLLVASHRKLEALAMLLAEMAAPSSSPRASVLRPVLTRMLHAVGSLAVGALVVVLSTALLPPMTALALLAVIAGLLTWLFGRSFNAWYTRAKVALVEAWEAPPPEIERSVVLPPMLNAAKLELFTVPAAPPAGKLIRELDLRHRTGASIVALDRFGKRTVNPGPDDDLQPGDKILLLGEPAQLRAAIELLSSTA